MQGFCSRHGRKGEEANEVKRTGRKMESTEMGVKIKKEESMYVWVV